MVHFCNPSSFGSGYKRITSQLKVSPGKIKVRDPPPSQKISQMWWFTPVIPAM
jgi:hypothetical protein